MVELFQLLQAFHEVYNPKLEIFILNKEKKIFLVLWVESLEALDRHLNWQTEKEQITSD